MSENGLHWCTVSSSSLRLPTGRRILFRNCRDVLQGYHEPSHAPPHQACELQRLLDQVRRRCSSPFRVAFLPWFHLRCRFRHLSLRSCWWYVIIHLLQHQSFELLYSVYSIPYSYTSPSHISPPLPYSSLHCNSPLAEKGFKESPYIHRAIQMEEYKAKKGHYPH